ncbi:MAG: hypothetical protein IJY97_10360 [Clostridia bacterium]|nr:hypothetical protein [Clostridia bacterium]
MKKLIALILAPLCLLGLVACFPVDPGSGNTVAYAGWSDDPMIAGGALNKGQLGNENSNHLPIFRFDTLDDLNQFKAKYDGVLALDQGYNSVLSFNEALSKAQWDREGFFKDHSLLAVYVPANSGSLRFALHNIEVTYESVCVYVEQTNSPEIFTEDMAGWFVLVDIEDEEISSCYAFDAIFVNSGK